MKEPQIHSHITDGLDPDHPLANQQVNCRRCKQQVHSFVNECMQTWVETGKGDFCMYCFGLLATAVLSNDYGIPEPKQIRNHVTCDICGEWYEKEPEQCRVCGEDHLFTIKD